MDIWLIAATAATGYIAKQLQNVTKGKGNFLESSSSEETVKKKQETPCTSLLSRLASVKRPNENKFGEEEVVASTSGENSGDYGDDLFGLVPVFPETGHGYWKASGETELSSCFRQRRLVKRNQRYRRLTKPLSSMESCLMSRFHGEEMSMEDYLTSPFPSPRGALVSRPLLVTDGTRVISERAVDSFWLSQQQITSLNEDKAAHSWKSRKHGLSDATVLLQIGISIGIMASFMASQAEASKVKQELKETENVVHGLEDELEMKDSLIVEEKAAENSESISNIEAELEAELERLEINMNTSNMVEMEPDLEVEFAQGELIADRVGRGKRVDETEANQDPSGNSTPESANYAVSPRELSLRLHKVINSRLEKRITELEAALQESQRKVDQLVMESESKKKNSWSRVWETREVMTTYKSDSIANKSNLTEMQPLVMNLTGEALDAFNESYDELMNINDDSEDDDDDDDDESPLEMQESELHHHEDLSTTLPWSHHHQDDYKVQEQELLDFIGLEEEEEDEENSDLESEMEKQLIKQIVEKTKQGSPVVLNAQKMLSLMEESEQGFKILDHI